MPTNKESAIKFLNLVIAGKIDEAYKTYVDMSGKHHNAFTPAGFVALRDGMKDAHTAFPNKQFDVQHALEDGDLVAVHSRLALEPNKPPMAVLHLFRFAKGKIVEMWDIGQPLAEMKNSDGAF